MSSFGKCSICTLNFNLNLNDIYSIICGHTFHQECIYRWTAVKDECPTCRFPNVADNIRHIFIDEADPDGTININVNYFY